MKSKDQMLLEEAYNKVAAPQNEIIDEGVWSQLKGLGKGIVAGAKTGAQNLAAGAAKAIGVKVDDTGRQTMGQSYAKAQQGSMLKDFQTNAEKTVNDFINDAKKMGVDLNDPNIIKQFPEAAAAYKEVQNLLTYVKDPSKAPSSSAPAAAPSSSKKEQYDKARFVRDEIKKYADIGEFSIKDPAIQKLLGLIRADIEQKRPRTKKTSTSTK